MTLTAPAGQRRPHTHVELVELAREAWRNSERCTGRLHWEQLQVIDARDALGPLEVAEAMIDHLHVAWNAGKIRSVCTILDPGVRVVLNHELLGFADDPMNQPLVDYLRDVAGWHVPAEPWSLLPLVVEAHGEQAVIPLPSDCRYVVSIRDPRLPILDELCVQWPAIPVLSDMRLETAEVTYTGAPFNGWYMETEIGARNLADPWRYDLLPAVAADLGLDTSKDRTLWKDLAVVTAGARTCATARNHPRSPGATRTVPWVPRRR